MSTLQKLFIGAIGFLLVALYIMYINGFLGTAKDGMNMSQEGIAEGMAGIAGSKFDVYDGAVQTGENVRSVINSTFADSTIEVLVCTKDGYNFVYNTEGNPIFGVTTTLGSNVYDKSENYGNCYIITDASDGQILSNLAPYDATGKGFSSTDTQGTVAAVRKAPTEGNLVNAPGLDSSLNVKVETLSGYNSLAPIMAPGYISDTAQFIGSVQKDVNNTVRRITFVQR